MGFAQLVQHLIETPHFTPFFDIDRQIRKLPPAIFLEKLVKIPVGFLAPWPPCIRTLLIAYQPVKIPVWLSAP